LESNTWCWWIYFRVIKVFQVTKLSRKIKHNLKRKEETTIC
jgi:hypothetical protein